MKKSLDGVKRVHHHVIAKDSLLERPKESANFGVKKAAEKIGKFFYKIQERKMEKMRRKEEQKMEKSTLPEKLAKADGINEPFITKQPLNMDDIWGKENGGRDKEMLLRAKAKMRAEKLAARLKQKEERRKLKQERKIARQAAKEKKKTVVKESCLMLVVRCRRTFNLWRERISGKTKAAGKNLKKHIRALSGVLIGAAAVLILAVSVSGYFVYTRKPSDSLVNLLVNKFPFPAVFVNWQPISYARYLEDKRLLSDYYAAQGEAADGEDVILEKLIGDKILGWLAQTYGIKLTAQEKEAAFNKLAEQNGGQENFADKIYNDYGLTKDLFINKIVYYHALRDKIKAAFISDDQAHKGAALRMAKVEELLGKGTQSFEVLAEKYSEGPHALQGGDSGYVKTKDMDEILRAAVENLAVGDISDVIKTEDSYYIVKVYDRKISRQKEEEVWLKQITILTNYTFDQYLSDLRTKAKVWVLIK